MPWTRISPLFDTWYLEPQKQEDPKKKGDMSRPAGDGKIINSNVSSYNLIAHDRRIPQSPLYDPSKQVPQPDQRKDWDEGKAGRPEVDDRYVVDNRGSEKVPAGYNPYSQEFHSPREVIKHEQHVPNSPLYRPAPEQIPIEPRYGGDRAVRREYGQPSDGDIPRPREPPTPDYNTIQMHIDARNRDDDTKLKLSEMRSSQEDLRDYRHGRLWVGPICTDRPGHVHTDRHGHSHNHSHSPVEDRGAYSQRERISPSNPWTERARQHGEVADPRVGVYIGSTGLAGTRNGGALLFIKFPVYQGDNVEVAAQIFLKSKTHDTGGRFLGLARKVHYFGYEKGQEEALAVYHFPNMDKALLFFQLDKSIRQPDFPPPYGHCEMWIVCNAYLPDNLSLFNTFLLSEVELHNGKDRRDFFEAVQKPFESYLFKNGAMPFVICSYGNNDRKSLRRHCYKPNAIVTCHLFQGLDHLNWILNDETYSKFRSLHNQMATEKCSIFTLVKEMFP